MSFTNSPVSKTLVVSLVSLSILASLLDVKHDFYILTDLHIWKYGQLWRLLTFQLVYSNATEVLFGSMTLYYLRVVERMWGSRKFASFLIISYILSSLLIPLVQVLFLAPLSRGYLTYIPSGPTPIIFSILAQYHAMVPHLYSYRVVLPPSARVLSGHQSSSQPSSSQAGSSSRLGPSTSQQPTPANTTQDPSGPGASGPPGQPPLPHPAHTLSSSPGLTFSDKSTKYIPPVHLFLSSLPLSPWLAFFGWTVGHLYRTDLLPAKLTRWRVPGWLVGVVDAKIGGDRTTREGFEGLQRRLAEGEEVRGEGSGVQQQQQDRQGESRRRNMGQTLMDQFRGAF
ncbi:uncharacterized protein MKZ38_001102 [Zalerion maritima]|uniref:Derlin n=1 Tax=Zalerion maritima TaxID=339359 RepID=A0AAD5WTG2_9PEZI|nr:uncharacterized protein MKZ38_001102 [Zalerion maritima]